VIAGEGPLKDPLIRKTRSLGLEDNIHFKGFIADMDEFYCSLDLFVLTSYWEGCSNVILEAMDWGLPVVAFHNSSVPELVQDTVNGFLVKNGNAGDLAEKVELLSINNGLRLNYGKAGRQIAREKFNLQKSFDQLMALI
jgi:glycosyltransferase involved in cell wall biosynthesis